MSICSEIYHPAVMFAGLLADDITDGLTLTLKNGVYTGHGTSRGRARKLLWKLSKKYHLVATANSTREEEAEENSLMYAAGWELVAPAGMRTSDFSPLREADCPYMFCLYGYPRTNKEPPKLPQGLKRVTPEQYRLMVDYFRGIFRVKFGADKQ